MEERRSDSRFHAVELQISLLLDDGERKVETRDIGKGGLCVTHSAPLNVGERRRVSLMLDLGENRFSEPLELDVRIVWCTELSAGTFQLGATFDALGMQERQALEQMLYLMSREVGEDERGRLRFRTAMVPIIDPGE